MSEPVVNRTLSARLARGVRDAWVIVGICLFLVFVVDAVLRELTGNDTEGPSRLNAQFYAEAEWTEAYWEEHKRAKQMHWTPYVYWRRDAFAGTQINIDDDGIRTTVSPHGPESGLPEVWVFGGSSIWGTGVPDSLTLPSLLAAELAERGGNYRVVNFGESGYVSTQSLVALALALRERPAPDVVVFVEGANDVYAAYQTGTAGTPQNEFRRRAEFRSSDGFDNYLATFPYVLEGVMRISAQSPQWQVDELASQVIDVMEANRKQALALGDAYDFSVIHVWQPTVFELREPSEFEREIIAGVDERHAELQRAAGAAVGRASCFSTLNDKLSLLAEDRFMDFVHPGPAVNHAMAEEIAKMVVTSPDCLPLSDSLADTPRG